MNIDQKPQIHHSAGKGWAVSVGNYVSHFATWGLARDFATQVVGKHVRALARTRTIVPCGAVGPYIPDGSWLHCYLPGGHVHAHQADPESGYTESWGWDDAR